MRLLFFLVFLVSVPGYSQFKKRVLFLGNSYTERNNLPQITSNIARSTGDTLLFDSHYPGGYTLLRHVSDNISLNKIMSNEWDYVVLQEQSQRPALGDEEVSKFFRNGKILDSLIRSVNKCTETVFFMTWGRKNGDEEYCGLIPSFCSYEGMDSLLSNSYRKISDSLEAVLSPVGACWNHLRKTSPEIDLFHADGSHPSEAGSFAAAVAFYTTIFRKNPLDIPYDYSLTSPIAQKIKHAVKKVVFDSLSKWKIGYRDPLPSFNYQLLPDNIVVFKNNTIKGDTYQWNFGDGNFSSEENPVHKYVMNDTFKVLLTATHCNISKIFSDVVSLRTTLARNPLEENNLNIFPNPVIDQLFIPIEKFDKIFIFDTFGQFYEPKVSFSFNRMVLDFSFYSSGIYFVRINSGTYSRWWKVIKMNSP